MSKFMKFWLLIICFLFIFLIIFTDRVNAETLSNVRIYGIQYCSPEQFLTTGTSYSSPYIYSGSASCNNVTTSVIRVYWSNVGNQMANKDIYFTTNVIGSIMGGVNIRDNNGHVYPCENYTASRDGMVNVICKNVGAFDNAGASYEYITYGGYNARATCSLPYVTNHDDYYNAMIYSSVISTHSDLQAIITAINSLKTQDNTNTQNIINNQNQNAQQQHQDAQQQYNYISNTTINNQNYTDTQNISDSNTNTQTKSVVMNFWLIPLNFFNSIIASFENTCTQVCVGDCGNGSGGSHDNAWRFVFPCLDIKGFVGNTIYNTIDAFFSVSMIFAFVKRAKNFFINALMLTNDVASEVSVF